MKAAHRGSKRPSEEDPEEEEVKPKKPKAKAKAKAAGAKAKAKQSKESKEPNADVKEPPKNNEGTQVDTKQDAPPAVDLGEAWEKKAWSIV